MSIVHDTYAERFGFSYREGGGVTTARGFSAAGVSAGFRANPNRLDLALVVADQPCAAAGVFTKNVFCAAPVQYSRGVLDACPTRGACGIARVVVINSGNANAATGAKGLAVCKEEADLAAQVIGCPSEEVLIASTGVIGVQLPLDPFHVGLPQAVRVLSRDGGADAASAIMTTDTYSKECAVTIPGEDLGLPGQTFAIGGMAKGSGMIMPNMATMIAVITTDVPVVAEDLHDALKTAADVSFNKVTVDSDTSTNDTCIALASGMLEDGNADEELCLQPDTPAFATFQAALNQVCITLARAMAADGEGASKLINVRVEGAATVEEADIAARAIANSPLVKTAIAGHDANWGRVAMAIGKSGAHFNQTDVDIDILGLAVCRAGLTQDFDEEEALRLFEQPEVDIRVDLGAGDAECVIWTCDLTHDYITINGDYRT